MLDTTFILYWAIIAGVMLLSIRQPAVAVGLYLCMFCFKQWAQGNNGWFVTHSTLTNFVVAGVLAYAIGVRQVRGIGTLAGGMPGMFWLVLVLFGWSFFSLLWSPAADAGFANFRMQTPYLLTGFVLVPMLVRSLADARVALLTMMGMGSLVLVLLLTTTQWSGRNILLANEFGTLDSNPLAVASLGGWVALAALLINFRGVGRWFGWLRYALVGLGLYVAFKSESRGQVFALLTAGLVALPVSRGLGDARRIIVTALTAIVLLYLGSLVFGLADVSETRWSRDEMVEVYEESRVETSRVVLGAWSQAGPFAWVAGLGSSASFSDDLLGVYPHLVLLEVLGELGLIGFLLLNIVTWMTLYHVYKLGRLAQTPEARGIAAAVGAMFLFEVILSFKQGSLLGSHFAFAFAIVIGRMLQDQSKNAVVAGEVPASAFAPLAVSPRADVQTSRPLRASERLRLRNATPEAHRL